MDALVESLLDNYESFRTEPVATPPPKPSPSPQPSSTSSSNISPAPQTKRRQQVREWKKSHHVQAIAPAERRCKKTGCNSTEIIEDVNEGFVVCTQCGMIQAMFVFENAGTDAIYHEGVSRIAVHRYSRIVYLRGILKSFSGETRLTFDPGDPAMILWFFQKEENANLPENITSVKLALKWMNLPLRYVYHASTIAWLLWKTPLPLPDAEKVREIFRLFRALENVWDREPLAGSIRKGRKKFPSYPLTWRFICEVQGHEELRDLVPGLATPKLIARQWEILKRMLAKI